MEYTAKFKQRNRILFWWPTAPILAFLVLVTGPGFGEQAYLPDIFEVMGVMAVVSCIAGRCWSVLYIGAKKNSELVRSGPYALTRNPPYFFSALGMFGVGLLAESLTLGIILGLFTFVVSRHVAKREERDLLRLFGAEFERYCAEVPRFFPKLSAMASWRVTDEPITVSPRVLLRTFIDASVFLLAFPAAELLDYLHATGKVAVLLQLYR